MCMTLVVSHRVGSLVCVDTRQNAHFTDGTVQRWDPGGKLRRVGSTWVTGAGDGLFMEAGFEALAKVECENMAAVQAALAATAERVKEICWTPGSKPERTVFQLGGAGWAATFAWNGRLVGASGSHWAASYPDPREAPREYVLPRYHALGERLDAAPSLPALLRAVAEEFAAVSARCESMSREIEAGTGDGRRIRIRAAELAQLSDAEIEARLEPFRPSLTRVECSAGIIVSGAFQNAANTAGLNLDATGTGEFLYHPGLTLRGDGSAEFLGGVSIEVGHSLDFFTDTPVYGIGGSVEYGGAGGMRMESAAGPYIYVGKAFVSPPDVYTIATLSADRIELIGQVLMDTIRIGGTAYTVTRDANGFLKAT
jgi:hypothetical protein